jgi:hypothetical protein
MTLDKPSPPVRAGSGAIDGLAVKFDLPRNNTSQGRPQAQICILGVDPGTSGAIAFYFPAAPGRAVAEDMPTVGGNVDAANLAARIMQMRPDFAVVERVASRTGQGVASVFKFGAAYGAVLGCLAACGVPMQLIITPGVWKRHFRLGADKEQSRAAAIQLFPACASHFSRKRDHNRAEAALLAALAQNLF